MNSVCLGEGRPTSETTIFQYYHQLTYITLNKQSALFLCYEIAEHSISPKSITLAVFFMKMVFHYNITSLQVSCHHLPSWLLNLLSPY